MTNFKDIKSNSTIKLKDFFLTEEEFELFENKEYGFLETHPQPVELEQYYDSKNYISHTDSKNSWFEKVYQLVKNHNISYKFNKLKVEKKEASLLDFGCGTGDFLAYAKNRNLNVIGIEPNENARHITAKKLGEKSVSNKKLSEENGQFDYITLWHVLEHLPDLFDFIDQLKSKLKDDGVLMIAVPNHRSFDAQFYKEHWAAYDVPRHLWHFSPESMQKLFNSFGMKIEKTHPLWFDSYYVSMLSERYKKNPFGILRAILVASTSNFLGLFTGNYSSVIYRITKNQK